MRPFREIPRPRGHPIFANLPDWLGVSKAKRMIQTLIGYAEECGGLVRVPLGPVNLLLVTEPDLIARVLSEKTTNFKGLSYTLTRAVMNNVMLMNGDVWQTHRLLYREALRDVRPFPSAHRVLSERLSQWRELPAGSEVLLDREVSRTSAEICGELVCGRAFPQALDGHRELLQHELAGIGIDVQCQPWAYLSPMRWVRMRRALRATRRFFSDAAHARRREPQPERRDALAGFLRQVGSGEYRDDAVSEGLINLFFTAHDVLTCAAMWCLYLLAEHPTEQGRLHDELGRIDAESLATDDLPRLAYLSQVVRESLRLFPGYPLFARENRGPFELAGFRVPPKTMIIIAPMVVHRLERYWEDPNRFDPSRWHQRPEDPLPSGIHDNYFPFGAGRRGCIASFVAYPLVKLIVARTIAAVRLRARPGHEPRLAYWGTTRSDNGLPVTIEPT